MGLKIFHKLKQPFLVSVLLLVFAMAGISIAQNEGDILWTKYYGMTNDDDIAHHIQRTSDGGLIIAGFTNGYNQSDFWLLKTDANGDTTWTRTYNMVPEEMEVAEAVKQTRDGGYIVLGWVATTLLVYNMYVVKTDSIGDTLWTWRNPGYDYAQMYDVEETAAGDFVMVGKSGELFHDYDIYLIKLSANGDSLWTRTYGGDDHQEAFDVEIATDGGFVITGYTGHCPNYDAYLIRTDAQGDSLWGKTYGGSYIEYGQCVKKTADGGYIIAGATESYTPGLLEAYFVKTDSNGDTTWTKHYGNSSFMDEAYSIYPTNDGEYIASGYYGLSPRDVNIFVIKMNDRGDSLWALIPGGSDSEIGYSVTQGSNDNYYVVGNSRSNGPGLDDVFIMSIQGHDPVYGTISGSIIDPDRDPIEDVVVNADGNICFTGSEGTFLLRDAQAGIYDVSFSHNDYVDTVITGVRVFGGYDTKLNFMMLPSASEFEYVPGDVNMAVGQWPPSVIGGDVTYLVNYFRGQVANCNLDGFYCSADVNGSCSVNGSDVTYLVNYFRGMNPIEYCPDYPSAWTEEVPSEAPHGWPNCE